MTGGASRHARISSLPRWGACLCLLASLLAPPAVPAMAQTMAATLFVEVRDQSGAWLPDVTITLTDQQTALMREGTTSSSGLLVIPLLTAGTYTLQASRDGFKTEIVRDIAVQAGVRGTVAVVLVPGEVTEQVVVSADLTTLRAGSGAVGEVFEGETLVTVPVSERDVIQFTFQAPGVAPPAPGSRLSTQGNTGLNNSGSREAANNFLLDGVDNNDLFLNRLVVNPSLDAVKEVSMLQGTYDAEHGRSAGAQVNVVIKSGTRTLRGSAYEYFRDEAFDARPAFLPEGTDKPSLGKHQFGGTIGGPLGRFPSFYFFNVEAIQANEADTRLARVPTDAERAGDFSTFGRPIIDPFTQQPFPGNMIPASRMSAAGLNTADLYPRANTSGSGSANYVSSPEGRRDAIQFTIKTDHNGWQDKPFHVRYTFGREDRDLPFPARARNLPTFGTSVLDQGHNFAAGFNQAISSRVVNELRFGVNALKRDSLPTNAGTDAYAALGITGPSLPEVDQGYPTFVVSGYETLGDDPNLPVLRSTRTIHLADTLTAQFGRHHVKTGGEFRHYKSDGLNHLFARGQITFAGAISGAPFADLLLGYPSLSLLGTNDNPQKLRTWSINTFIQDDWRLSSRLTVNMGLRYEFNSPPVDADDRMRIFDQDTNQIVQVGTNGVPRSGIASDYNNVAPRIGFNYDLTGMGTTMLQGGYGLFYNVSTLIETSALYFNPPYFAIGLYFPSQLRLLTLENPFPGQAIGTQPTYNSLDQDMRTAYAHQFSLGVEHAFAKTTVDARYVGSFGHALVRKRNINQALPGPGPFPPRREMPQYGDILMVESGATSDYHALQVGAVRRSGSRLMFRASYTWSKSMDDQSAFLATDGNDNTPQDSRNLAAEWGLSDFDVRHRGVLSGSYVIPDMGSGALGRGWQVAGVVSVQSGRPFTPRVSFDNSNSGNTGGGTFAYDRPNEVTDTTPPAGARVVSYEGRSFVIAPQYTYGNAGRNALIGPGYAAVDAVLSRRLELGGSKNLELRLEGFNLLNRTNLQLPDSFVDRPTFGQSLSAFSRRQFQLAARFTF
ncbi:Outer membrane receptor for ferrienterochelin and colicins [Luteitalea pratensis]|uniref:Outer membrane receptor for ferrienterochelin and colicins n=1 Tax=Luteitalea pratensis TaxID=1855912 RepID=A0A143PUC5_LUTPR|nr:TonB-dependent receptor [Luteitalea pratensis]AMY12182.1 Outer membrane receptor for ferrienterochelin and colicins [Luteitalea pratensis]